MITPFSTFPKIVAIEDDFDDWLCNISDIVSPFSMMPCSYYDPYYTSKKHHKLHDRKYIISIGVGPGYRIEDINTSFDGRKLKVHGSVEQVIQNGKNHHQFEREYEIPEEVELQTMQKTLSHDGTLRITFDKKVVEPRKDIEDLSKDSEYKIKMSIHGFKQDEVLVKVVGRNLVIEASKKCESKPECCKSESCYSRYFSRSIRMGDEVEIDKLRVVYTPDEYLEISAPRDQAKLKPTERTLQIEK